jgi:hypothetical protein
VTRAALLGPPWDRLRAALALCAARWVRPRPRPDGARERRCLRALLVVERDLPARAEAGAEAAPLVAREVHAGRLLRSEELARVGGRLVRHGTLVAWTRDGKALATSSWRMGRLHGPSRACWPRGGLRAHGSWIDDREDGEWWHAHADGRLDRARTGLWRAGTRIGGIKGFNDWLGSP